MVDHLVTFDIASAPVSVPTGTLLSEAARLAGVEIGQPCGGQGRCGRCAVHITSGSVRRRSTVRLSAEDVESGWALACQSVIEGDISVVVPPQEKIERRLTTDRIVADVTVPEGYSFSHVQTLRRVRLELSSPSMEDQTDDLSRLQLAIRQQSGLKEVDVSLPMLQKVGTVLREGNWVVTAILDVPGGDDHGRLIELLPGRIQDDVPLWGLAVDIGTTTVTVWLVDLTTGKVKAQAAEYNGQISRGEDVVSRIIYASKVWFCCQGSCCSR